MLATPSVPPSIKTACFMDGKTILCVPSMNLSVFMDGKLILLAPSMNMSVFMDGPSFQGKVEQGNRLRRCLQSTLPCSTARKQPMEQANHHQKRFQGTSPCSILPGGEEKKSPAVKLSAGNRKQSKNNSGVYRISAEATTFATLARRAATLPLSAGWTRWVRSITAQRASRSMTIEVPV